VRSPRPRLAAASDAPHDAASDAPHDAASDAPHDAAPVPRVSRDAFVLLFHGSRAEGALAFERTIASAVATLATEHYVDYAAAEVAHLGSPPSLDDAVAACARQGATRVIVVPMLFVPGVHAEVDVPRLRAEACAKFPELTIEVSELFGKHPALAEAILVLLRATKS